MVRLPNIFAVIEEKSDATTKVFHFSEGPVIEVVNGSPKTEQLLVPSEAMREFLLDHPGIFEGLKNLEDFAHADKAIEALNARVSELTETVAALQI